ncbi:hypothetical protein YC2023_040455 [Brassica napus]|uniref:Uncharacterized protein n=2 Tax=Brassica TaxID=3705 RepID=A0A3P6ARM5_BRAOL|nr:unnamed protein product [Brassica napus]VDC95342.1 unnamed protein product [Brassica oleracea]
MMQPSPNLTASPDSSPIVLTNTSYINGGIPYVLSDLKPRNSSLSLQDRVKLLLALAKEYGVNREQISLLMNERSLGDDGELRSTNNEALSTVSYRIEWNMRHALKPTPATLKLHQITWNDYASLLEKTFAYEVMICQELHVCPASALKATSRLQLIRPPAVMASTY